MTQDFTFYNRDNNKDVHVHIKLEQNAVPGVQQNTKNPTTTPESLLFQRIIADSISFIQKDRDNISITIARIDSANDEVSYRIEGEPGIPLHKISLKITQLSNEINKIAKHKITPVGNFTNQNVKSLLARFAKDEPAPSGFFAMIKRIVSKIFEALRKQFSFIDDLWEGITNESAKKLKWDINVLAEVVGEAPTEQISIHDALVYICKLMEQETGIGNDKVLKARLQEAINLSKEQEALRDWFSKEKLEKNTHVLLGQINALKGEDKLLIPVGYYDNGNLQELLLEVNNEPGGTFSVTLISSSNDIRTYFDREQHPQGGKQSNRRTILNVKKEDLQSRLRILLELSTSPMCRYSDPGHSWRSLFFESFKFPDSVIAYTPPSEKFSHGVSSGYLKEVISYLDEAQGNKEEAQHFDMALRLRLFLDICQTNKKSWNNPRFRELVRKTILELAKEIESNKALFGDSSAQGIELSNIYIQLQEVFATLEDHPLKVTNPGTQIFWNISGKINAQPNIEAPMLTLKKMNLTQAVDVDPSFVLFDRNQPADTFNIWITRFQQLAAHKLHETASNEAKLIIRMLPPLEDTIWKGLSFPEIENFISLLNEAAKALTQHAQEMEDATVEELLAITAINYHAYHVAANYGNVDFDENIPALVKELLECRITPEDKERLKTFNQSTTNPQLQSQKPKISLRLGASVKTMRELNQTFHKNTPLYLQNPEYAEKTAREITNRYITQQCPLGCTRDDCVNYAKVDKSDHRFHPLYMVHNYADIFVNKSINDGLLTRTEAIDLLYTQTTLQSANQLITDKHDSMHGTTFAHGFDQADEKIQAMQTWTTFMQHPQFFKSPELRWHFETKLFTKDTFIALMDDEHLPFLHALVKQLTKEIKVVYASADIEKCAYLVYVQEKIHTLINQAKSNESQGLLDRLMMNPSKKEGLLKLLLPNAKNLLDRLFRDSLNVTESLTEDAQIVLYGIYTNIYFERFCHNPQAPFLENKEDLINLMIMSQRIEGMKNSYDKMDPALVERYQTLLSLVYPAAKKHSLDKGHFVNSLLTVDQPTVASKQLAWELTRFPIYVAYDENQTKYHYNIKTGEATIGPHRADPLPTIIANEPTVKKLFGQILNDATWSMLTTPEGLTGHDSLAYTHPLFPEFRILIQKTESKKRAIVVERSVLNPAGNKEWAAYVRYRDQDRVLNGEEILHDDDLPMQVAAAIGDRDCWISTKKEYVYVMEGKNTQPYAFIKLKNVTIQNNTETHVANMVFMDDRKSLLQPNKQALERFTTIESERFLQIKGKRNRAEEVEYIKCALAGSNAKLKYQVKEKEITSINFPGYRLADYGSRPGSKDPSFSVKPLPDTFDGYQYLQQNGREKILIPMRPFIQQFDVKGNAIPYSKALFTNDLMNTPVFEYDVDPETNRLKATSSEAYVYLAYLCLTHNDIGSSKFYLGKATTSTGYTHAHDHVMNWLTDWKESAPNGKAMHLRFALFQEKIIEDHRHLYLVKGEQKKLEQIDFNRFARLAALARHYRSYTTKPATRQEIDPSLALSPEEHFQAQKLIKEFLEKHGDELVDKKEFIPLRAANIFQHHYLDNDTKDPLINQKGTMLLWSQRIGEKGLSPVTIRNSLWIVQNFVDIFNKLLKEDIHSVAFKQLVLQVEMISNMPMGSFNSVEVESIELAQSYLLKLVSAKRNHPAIFNQFPTFLANNGLEILPDFTGPWLTSTRHKMLALAAHAAKMGVYSEASMKNQKSALKQLQSVQWDIRPAKQVNPDELRVKNLVKGLETFINQYNGGNKQFYSTYRKHLLEIFYGTSTANNLYIIDSIFKVLESIPISLFSQEQAKGPAIKVKSSETNQMRYAPLLTAPMPVTASEEILKLEKVLLTENKLRPDLIITPVDKQAFVLGSLVKEVNDQYLFKISHTPPPVIDRTLFNILKSSNEPAVVRNATEHEKDLDAALNDKKTVNIIPGGAEAIRMQLDRAAKQSDDHLEALRKDLMQFIDHYDTPAGVLAMRRMTGKSMKLNIDNLIALWRSEQITNKWEENPFKTLGMKSITPQNLKDLDAKIHDYLMTATSRKHLQRTLDAVKEYLADDSESLALEIHDSLETKRSYAPDDLDARDFLFMEHSLGIILRKGQVETFRDMASNPNAVRQLNMGGGKSKVILPLLAKRKATGQNLVMLILPDELYETNCRDLDITNRMLFGQEMHRFVFNRATEKNLEALQLQHLRLLKTIEQKGFVMTTKRSMLSFRNAFIEKLHALQRLHPNDILQKERLLAEIREMNSILYLFKNHMDMIADEVDACLDIRKEVNFSLGATTTIDQTKKDVSIQMMETVLQAEEGILSKLKENLIRNTQGSFSAAEIDQCMEEIAKKFRQKTCPSFDEKGFIDYMMDRPEGFKIKLEVDKLKKTNVQLYQQITALKGFIHQGFGNTLKRVGRVNYGRDPVSGIWTIPFKASEAPQIGSEFDDEIERIAFTVQDYIQFGVNYKQVYQKIAELHMRATQELRVAKEDPDNLMSINDTQAASDFQELMKKIDPTGKAGTKLTLSAVAAPKRIQALVDSINSSPESRLYYASNMVLNQMQQTNIQINSNSSDLTDMALHFSGFTGTPYNLHTFNDKIEGEKNLGVDGQTWALMLSRNIPIQTFDFDAKKPADSLLSELKIVGNHQAVIDTGAYLRGVTNETFIDKAFKHAKDKNIKLEGGIYFDQSGKIVKKTSLTSAALPLEAAPETDLKHTLTLYDQAHTVGADIKQWKKAVAVVTIGEDTFIRDLFQAVRRLRQLDKEQTFTLAVSTQIKDKILAGESRDLTMNDILIFCLKNEIKRESEDNFRAEKGKITNMAKKTALNITIDLIHNGLDDKGLINAAKILASKDDALLLKERAGEETFDSYGKMKTEEKSQDQLERLKISESTLCTKIAEKFKSVHQKAMQALKTAEAMIKSRLARPLDWMPNTVDASLDICGKEVELETMAELELALEIETEINSELNVSKEVDLLIPMVATGAAGSGEVHSIQQAALEKLSASIDSSDKLRRVSNICNFFDKGIYCTEVFERNLPKYQQQNASPQSLFYSTRKTPHYGLIFKDDQGAFKMVIPTVHEVHAACRSFATGNSKEAAVVAITPAEPLMFYKSGTDRTEALPFINENDRKAFYRLYVQLKLFNGEIEFPSAPEKEALADWLKEKGVKEFKSYFEQNIVSTKPRAVADAYLQSSLLGVFENLLTPAA